jgi:hypothetical protein
MRSAVILGGAVLLLGACTSAADSQESERRAAGQRSFQVGEFQSVSLQGAHDVIVTVGGAPSVRAEGDAEEIERLDIRVEDGALRIGTRRHGMLTGFQRRRGVTVYVTAPALTGASIGGSGDMRIDRVQAPAFDASIGGSGDLEIGGLQAGRAHFAVAGSGGIRAAGTADEANISIAGSGNINLDALTARRAAVSVAGSGSISVRATEAVNGSIMGSGDVTVHGSARCSVSKMGSGEVVCGG